MKKEISKFFWIEVYIAENSHNNPNLQIIFKNNTCFIEIKSKKILEWELPIKVKNFILAWIGVYENKLISNWGLFQQWKHIIKIDPIKG